MSVFVRLCLLVGTSSRMPRSHTSPTSTALTNSAGILVLSKLSAWPARPFSRRTATDFCLGLASRRFRRLSGCFQLPLRVLSFTLGRRIFRLGRLESLPTKSRTSSCRSRYQPPSLIMLACRTASTTRGISRALPPRRPHDARLLRCRQPHRPRNALRPLLPGGQMSRTINNGQVIRTPRMSCPLSSRSLVSRYVRTRAQ